MFLQSLAAAVSCWVMNHEFHFLAGNMCFNQVVVSERSSTLASPIIWNKGSPA